MMNGVRRRSRSCATLLALAGLMTGPISLTPAPAHQPADYPFAWTYSITSRVFYYQSYPTGNWRDRLNDAMQRWNNVSGSNITFSTGGQAQDTDEACGVRDLVTKAPLAGSALMFTAGSTTYNSR
jgi:ABC-type sugar transport system substrate-binding protein